MILPNLAEWRVWNDMIRFITIIVTVYIFDLIGLIRSKRTKDIAILSVFTLLISAFGVFYLLDPYRDSFIVKIFSILNIEY